MSTQLNSNNLAKPVNPPKFGYMGKILWINLTTQEFKEEFPSDEIYRQYLGGYGLGAYFVYTRIKPLCDPMGPDNILGFVPGLFTGTAAPFTGRWMVVGKSPLTGKGKTSDGKECTGGWGDANAGGFFGPSIKRAGYDAIFFTGISKKPVYLFLDSTKKELKDASIVWGKNVSETEKKLKEIHGKGTQVACIGKAGENKSLISGIVNDGGRIAARSGLGAVMGAKNLKALCIGGTSKINVADQKKTIELAKAYKEHIEGNFKSKLASSVMKMAPALGPILRLAKMGMKSPESVLSKSMHIHGTSFSTAISAEMGDSPVQNLKGVGYIDFPQKVARNFAGASIDKYKVKSYGCFSCPIACGAIYKIPELGIEETHRPEYETLAAFGSNILNEDINTVFKINELLNQVGMDTISAGVTLGFIIECAEMGILKKEDFKCKAYPDGFIPKWHSSEYLLTMLQMMIDREGLGDVFADGTWVASKKLKNGSEKYAAACNGQELPMHDARATKGLALTYLTDPTPGRHTAASLDFTELGPINGLIKGLTYENSKDPYKKGFCQAKFAKFKQVWNALGFCEFGMWNGTYPLLEMMKAVFGWDITIEEILKIGWRIQTIRQMFNGREGAIRTESSPRIVGDPPLTKGPLSGISIDAEAMIQGYYEGIGYQNNGIPLETTIKELNMEYLLKDLPNCLGRPAPVLNSSIKKSKIKPIENTISPISESNQQSGIQELTVNLSGYFETKALNKAIQIKIQPHTTIAQIFLQLNSELKMKIFSQKAMEDNLITVIHNGNRIEPQKISTQIVNAGESFTVLQPRIGG